MKNYPQVKLGISNSYNGNISILTVWFTGKNKINLTAMFSATAM